ncbi:Protein of unknown function, partial [Gryllus bimaculatus]
MKKEVGNINIHHIPKDDELFARERSPARPEAPAERRQAVRARVRVQVGGPGGAARAQASAALRGVHQRSCCAAVRRCGAARAAPAAGHSVGAAEARQRRGRCEPRLHA